MDVLEATGVNVVHARVVDDGDLVTAGGVTSGLDLALHLLERSYGPQVAIAVEKLFEYERTGNGVERDRRLGCDVKTPIGSLAVVYTFTEQDGTLRHRGGQGRDGAAARHRR